MRPAKRDSMRGGRLREAGRRGAESVSAARGTAMENVREAEGRTGAGRAPEGPGRTATATFGRMGPGAAGALEGSPCLSARAKEAPREPSGRVAGTDAGSSPMTAAVMGLSVPPLPTSGGAASAAALSPAAEGRSGGGEKGAGRLGRPPTPGTAAGTGPRTAGRSGGEMDSELARSGSAKRCAGGTNGLGAGLGAAGGPGRS